jgi:uncharacterized membrane protein
VNIVLWVLQVVLALHTVAGALWKFSNSEQTVPSLGAIPHGAWLALMVFELLCALGLLLPAVRRRIAIVAPLAALGIAAEMLLFCGVHLASGDRNFSPMIYWLVVASVCALVAYGRLVVRPLNK